jgi:hypothetical protein
MQIDANSSGGATVSEAAVSWGSLFVDSSIEHVTITGSSSVGLRVFAAGSPGGMGPVLLSSVWVLHSASHNLLVEDATTNTGAIAGVTGLNVVSEHQGSNSSAIYLLGRGRFGQSNWYQTHIEQGGSETGRTGITIDGASDANFYGVQLQTGTPANITAGITITNVVQSARIQIYGVSNINIIHPVLNDVKNGVTFGAINLPIYRTPDIAITGAGAAFQPAGSTNKGWIANDSSGTNRLWTDGSGALTGSSAFGQGSVDIVGDATNNRPLVLVNSAKTRAFGWYYPDTSNLRFRYFTGGVDAINVDSSAGVTLYQGVTLNALGGITTLNTSVKGTGSAGAAPSSGTHVQGEIVFNANPSAGGFIGWVCVTGGTPGTWKSWGVISP